MAWAHEVGISEFPSLTMKKVKKDEDILFRCSCGAPEFLEVSIFHEKENKRWSSAFFFCIIAEPKDFWQRLKHLLKKQHFVKEVIVPEKDIKKLIKVLSQHI